MFHTYSVEYRTFASRPTMFNSMTAGQGEKCSEWENVFPPSLVSTFFSLPTRIEKGFLLLSCKIRVPFLFISKSTSLSIFSLFVCCICFIHDLNFGKDKLQQSNIKCDFLGYSHLQKGCKYYYLTTNKHLFLVDVTFCEDSPYFSVQIPSIKTLWLYQFLLFLLHKSPPSSSGL